MSRFLLFFLLTLSTTGFSQNNHGLKLWYSTPSGTVWENALPIGNGRLGAMVYGNVEKETIQLNEHTLWSGGPNRNDNPAALAALPEIRRLIFDNKQKEAEELANKTIITKKSNGQMFQPVGQSEPDVCRPRKLHELLPRTGYRAGGCQNDLYGRWRDLHPGNSGFVARPGHCYAINGQ